MALRWTVEPLVGRVSIRNAHGPITVHGNYAAQRTGNEQLGHLSLVWPGNKLVYRVPIPHSAQEQENVIRVVAFQGRPVH